MNTAFADESVLFTQIHVDLASTLFAIPCNPGVRGPGDCNVIFACTDMYSLIDILVFHKHGLKQYKKVLRDQNHSEMPRSSNKSCKRNLALFDKC